MTAETSDARCLYDEVFSNDEEVAREAIDSTFESIYDFTRRNYGGSLSTSDEKRLELVRQLGNHGLRLAFVLSMLANEPVIREEIDADVEDVATISKTTVFYRVISIATRGMFETPFTEENAHIIVSRFIQFCSIAWRCLDADSMSNFCDRFSARIVEGEPTDLRTATSSSSSSSSSSSPSSIIPPIEAARLFDEQALREMFHTTTTTK